MSVPQRRRYELCPIVGTILFDAIDETFDNKTDAMLKAQAILSEQPSFTSIHTVRINGYGQDGECIFTGFVLRNLTALVRKDTDS